MLAIIPARGGSKGLPQKNILELNGKPLIAYTIEAALKSKYINRVIVSTDDVKIAEIAKKFGAEIPFMRPDYLAADNALAIDNYIFTIEKLNSEENAGYEEFIVLQPTSPLRTETDIDEAIIKFKNNDVDSLISFTEVQHPPEWAKKITNNRVEDYFTGEFENKNRQEFKKAYLPNGAIYIFKFSVLKNVGKYYTDNTYPFIMPFEKSVDIDTIDDFKFAEFLLQKQIQENKLNENLENFIANENITIQAAIKKLDKGGMGILCVCNNKNRIVGIITDGDFRRALLNGIDLSQKVSKISNNNFIFLNKNYSQKDVVKIFQQNLHIQHIPVLNENGNLFEILYKDNFSHFLRANLLPNIPAVIMAGGKGTRMEPFSRILPKPLLPIGDKPVVELIMDNYVNYGISDFYISVNYKANIIKAYFESAKNKYNIQYIEEDKPLGTGGALKYLDGEIETPFFVSNCDIIIKDNYSEIYNFHKEGDFDLTIIASLQFHKVPYGVCSIKKGGELKKLVEKPEYDFLVNTGMYILNPGVLQYIPENTFYNITDLIDELKIQGKKIGVYPVSEKSYLDVGQWDEYNNVLKVFNK